MNSFNFKEYKKRLHVKKFPSFLILIFAIILLAFFAFYLYPTNTQKHTFYFVSISSFSTHSKASNFASEIKNLGGAGYVFFEKNYNVLACCFTNKKEAENVVENLKTTYKNASVINIEINKNFNTLSLSNLQKNCIENLLNLGVDTVKNLSKISIEFDSKNITLPKLKYHITTINNNFEKEYENFKTLFKTNSKFNAAKEHLNNINKNLKTLASYSSEQELNENFKFLIIDICANLKSFTNSIN